MFRLEIETSNAAFDQEPSAEVARILEDLAAKLRATPILYGMDGYKLRDINGNTVGTWQYIPYEEV